MPFIRYQAPGKTKIAQTPYFSTNTECPFLPAMTHEQAPIFLIPGILGHSSEQALLAQALQQQCKSNLPIFIYHDNRFLSSNRLHHSLQDQAKAIAADIQAIFPHDKVPHLIVGYSYGCALTALIAQYLSLPANSSRLPAQLYLIDGPSPETSRAYFQNPDRLEFVTADLIAIFNTVATCAGIDGIDYENGETAILNEQPISKRIESIMKDILEVNSDIPPSAEKSFQLFSSIVIQNLNQLIHYDPTLNPPQKHLANRFTVLMTEKTALKYSTRTGGWEKYTQNLSLVSDPYLAIQHHLDLLQAQSAKVLARSITDSLVTPAVKLAITDAASRCFLHNLEGVVDYSNPKNEREKFKLELYLLLIKSTTWPTGPLFSDSEDSSSIETFTSSEESSPGVLSPSGSPGDTSPLSGNKLPHHPPSNTPGADQHSSLFTLFGNSPSSHPKQPPKNASFSLT